MSKTTYRIVGDDFLINGRKTYAEIAGSDPKIHGLLFNTRFIQGIFEDRNPGNAGIYDRFGRTLDPGKNTRDLIRALPRWYENGIRAITVGLQGGGPVFTFRDWSVIETGCFSSDGKTMSAGYKERLETLLDACDQIGMLVIVSILYQAQEHLFDDGACLVRAIRTACEYLKSLPYDNVILEVANEHDVGNFARHPIVSSSEGMANLIGLAREWSGGRFAVGSSAGGGVFEPIVGKCSDVVLVHGNGLRRQEYHQFIRRVRTYVPDKPIVCNEDSPMFSQLSVSYVTHTSWGYYNNFTKQEPPADWEITRGEDEFFTRRLNMMVTGKPPRENAYYLQGLEPRSDIRGGYYVKTASLYPEKIDYVEYFEDDRLLYTVFDEPFFLYAISTWEQEPYFPGKQASVFRAVVHLPSNGQIVLTKNLREV